MADIAKVKRNIKKMIDADAPESDIDAYVASEGVTPEELRAGPKEKGTLIGNLVDRFTQGATFGAGDEITAAEAALLGRTPEGGWFDYSGTMGERYDNALEAERGQNKQFGEERPVLSTVTEIAGSIPTAMLPLGALGRAAQGGNLATRIGTGAAIGAGQGGVYGFNTGEGMKDRMKGAATGGAVGGVVGALAPAVGAGAKNIYNRFATSRAAKDIGMSRPAYEILRDVSQADDSLTGAGAKRIRAAGPSAMMADAGPSQRALLDVATQRTGPAARVATERVGQRATAAARTLTSTLDDLFGAPQGVKTTARNIAQTTSAARGGAYDAAYAAPINYADDAGRAIEDVLSRIPPRIKKQAIEDANEMMWAKGLKNNQILFDVAEDGSVIVREMPNVMQLDYIKRSLGEMGAGAVDNFGRPTGQGNMLTGLAREIRDSLREAVPEYGNALKLGSDKIARDKALQMGRDVFRPGVTRESIADAVEDMSDEARRAAMRGLRSSIDDALANVKRTIADGSVEAREAVKLIKDLSSRANREKVSALVGKESADRLFQETDQAAMAFDLRAGLAQNSKTFARDALNQTVDDTVNSGPVAALRSGEPIGAAKNVLQALMGGGPEAKKRVTDKVVTEMVDALTGPDPMRRLNLLEMLPARIEARRGQAGKIVEMLTQRNAPVTAQMRDALMSRQ